jgi:hypothetical protein
VGHVARRGETDMPTDFGKNLEEIKMSVDLLLNATAKWTLSVRVKYCGLDLLSTGQV